jgi:DNA-binding transcriptional regulator YiaG
MTQQESDDVAALIDARRWVRYGTARRIRERAGLSRQELANGCDVTASAVWNWEARRRVPRGSAALRYARLLRRLADEEARSGAGT